MRRLIALAGLLGLVALSLPAHAALAPAAVGSSGPRTRVAVAEFSLEGDGASPALSNQLQDGFVLGLVRGGLDVLDSTDVHKGLAAAPELENCETSLCLKRGGELLAARFVLRVRVGVNGNSYKMTARLFSTEGSAPAALPLAAQSRSCDVCTASEARDHMIKLADGMRARIEEQAPAPPAAPPPPPPHAVAGPLAIVAAGVAAVVGGALVISSASSSGKGRPALGGALMGAGVGTAVLGLCLVFDESPRMALLGISHTF